jgi:hypothetical protein
MNWWRKHRRELTVREPLEKIPKKDYPGQEIKNHRGARHTGRKRLEIARRNRALHGMTPEQAIKDVMPKNAPRSLRKWAQRRDVLQAVASAKKTDFDKTPTDLSESNDTTNVANDGGNEDKYRKDTSRESIQLRGDSVSNVNRIIKAAEIGEEVALYGINATPGIDKPIAEGKISITMSFFDSVWGQVDGELFHSTWNEHQMVFRGVNP